MTRRNPFVALDDFVLDRIAQPIVDRFPGVPLREQVRFCTTGLFVATAAKLGWLGHAGKLGGADVAWHVVMFASFAANYATAWDVSERMAARNPNRISPLFRAVRLLFLGLLALETSVLAAVLALRGWDTQGALLWAWSAIYTATIYAAACDNPPPPAPKAAVAPAGA